MRSFWVILIFSICSSLDHPESGLFFYREDRRRGYIGNDYGEDDDEVDYSKMYQEEEDVNLFVSKIHTSKTVSEYIFFVGQTSRS